MAPSEAADAVGAAYDAIGAVVDGCDAADLGRPTRAEGWTVRDLLLHLLLDAQRALVALASPASTPPDRDRFDYWRDFHPSRGDGGAAHADLVRRCATAYGDGAVLAMWSDTAPAAARAVAAAHPGDLVVTQGHVLTVADLASTLVVEACVHHLDLTAHLVDAPGPPAVALSETRLVLDRLLGSPFPPGMSDQHAVLLGTGRRSPTDADGTALGPAVRRLPLLG